MTTTAKERLCFVETLAPPFLFAKRFASYRNVAAMAVCDMREAFYSWQVEGQLDYYRSLEPHKRAVRWNWFCESRLSSKEIGNALEAHAGFTDPVLLYTDNEESHRDREQITNCMKMMANFAITTACNFDDSYPQCSGWWGPMGGLCGNASNFNCYDVMNNEQLKRLYRNLSFCQFEGTQSVLHLPVCKPFPYTGPLASQRDIEKYTRALLYNWAMKGNRYVIFADYMLPPNLVGWYVDLVSTILTDCDTIYPLES